MRKRRWGATESTIMTARATPRFHAQCSAVPCHWRSTHAAWRPATPLLSAGADRPPPSTVSGRAVREGLEGFEVGGLFSTIQHPATFQVWIRLGHISPPTHPPQHFAGGIPFGTMAKKYESPRPRGGGGSMHRDGGHSVKRFPLSPGFGSSFCRPRPSRPTASLPGNRWTLGNSPITPGGGG